MPAYTNTESRRQTHRQTSADNIALSFRAPWILWPPGSRFILPNGIHCSPDSGSGEELPFPQSRQPSSALAGLGLAPAGKSNPFPLYRKLSPAPDTFLFTAGPRIYTGLLVLPEHRCYIYPSPLSWKCSLSLVKGSRTSPQMLCPMSESLGGKREGFQDNATLKKREVYCWLESGLPSRVQRSGTGSESPEPKLLPNL